MVLIGNCIVCIKVFLKVMNLILRMKFDFFFLKVMLLEFFFIMVKKIKLRLKLYKICVKIVY